MTALLPAVLNATASVPDVPSDTIGSLAVKTRVTRSPAFARVFVALSDVNI